MNVPDLLGKTFDCECGREHSVPLREIVYQHDAVVAVPGVLARHTGARTVTVVVDARTYRVAGREVVGCLRAAGVTASVWVVPDCDREPPVCDDRTRDALRETIDHVPDAFIAVGSGVVNDLTKWVATDLSRPYMVVATAASMNGYSSRNIAPSIDGVKRVVPGTVPFAVVANPAVIADAPYRLTASGLGDLVAKPVSMTDWRINHLLFDEYYCPLCAELIRDLEPVYLNNPAGLAQRDPGTIEAVFSALIWSGVSMTVAGTSKPASGGEHLISHTLDMTAHVSRIPHDYHGRQVGVGTIFAAALYERLLASERPVFAVRTEPTDVGYWRDLSGAVEEQNAGKRGHAQRAVEYLRVPGVWDQVREIMRAGDISARRVKACLRDADCAHTIDGIGCTRERFVDAVLHCHQMRERFTVIDLSRAAGILPGAVHGIVDELL